MDSTATFGVDMGFRIGVTLWTLLESLYGIRSFWLTRNIDCISSENGHTGNTGKSRVVNSNGPSTELDHLLQTMISGERSSLLPRKDNPREPNMA